jgi:wyosine [tRNA(Phe)-imidazoG37] synthetase (radical SAM superfamily)
MSAKYIFGPVASRRLGASLGVDLTPSKTCSLNCIYCEAGETNALLRERREYVPVREVIRQLNEVLSLNPMLDYVTFSGAGEPTLNSGLGVVIDYIKNNFPQYPVCLLTNGVLLGDPNLQAEIAPVDLVVPSLDCSCEEEFQKINRPAPGLNFIALRDGLFDYALKRKNKLWLELFIVPGINDSDAAIERFAELVKGIKPDKVQLNTLDRPGCVEWIVPSSRVNTMRFINVLKNIVEVEAIGPFKYKSPGLCAEYQSETVDQSIIELVKRRPCTIADIQLALNLSGETLKKRLDSMVQAGILQSERQVRGEFFRSGDDGRID